jgi:hypothetical protein
MRGPAEDGPTNAHDEPEVEKVRTREQDGDEWEGEKVGAERERRLTNSKRKPVARCAKRPGQ